MFETGLALGMTATHVGVPLADLVAWALVLSLLAAPVTPDTGRRQRLMRAAERLNSEIGGAKPLSGAARCQSDKAGGAAVVAPAVTRLSAVQQWQAVSLLVSNGAERAMAVARDQQTIRRELDSLDFSLENLRRELSAVMTSTLPVPMRGPELVPVRVQSRPSVLAA
jgi:hypothetical protein